MTLIMLKTALEKIIELHNYPYPLHMYKMDVLQYFVEIFIVVENL